ncbi:MAG TPA: UbiA family prenyltransferase [Puia sp.]|nr:UbiA family prenyltransferase [Puia sp.]
MKIHASTIQLLRFHFSFFLMPVYWFALSQIQEINSRNAWLIFFILHGLVYPSSNGYNSYMDRDEGSIGGLKSPQPPTRQLYQVTLLMDFLALTLGMLISIPFALGILIYILASRAYSARQIRLKRYPVWGYLTVIVCQGGLVFYMVYHGADTGQTLHVPALGIIGASLLIGGFYPLTQIYQHEADAKDGVITLSASLGYRGTFVFCSIVYTAAFAVLAVLFQASLQLKEFLAFATAMLPVIVYFLVWGVKVWRNPAAANFTNAMRMNLLASVCSSIGFIVVFFMQRHLQS